MFRNQSWWFMLARSWIRVIRQTQKQNVSSPLTHCFLSISFGDYCLAFYKICHFVFLLVLPKKEYIFSAQTLIRINNKALEGIARRSWWSHYSHGIKWFINVPVCFPSGGGGDKIYARAAFISQNGFGPKFLVPICFVINFYQPWVQRWVMHLTFNVL